MGRPKIRTIAPRPCGTCRQTFFPAYEAAKYCSKSCAGKRPENIEQCKRTGREKANEIGNTKRGKGEGKSYRKFLGRHEHRIIAEQKLGRPLEKDEVVHHKDGNKLNNHPDNLLIMTQKYHMREHGIGIPEKAPTWCTQKKEMRNE